LSLGVEKWLAATHRPACLDVRSEAEFAAGHLPGAGNVPCDELTGRIHELPRRGETLFIVGGKEAERAAELLAERDRWRLEACSAPPETWPAAELVSGPPAPLWSPNAWLREHYRTLPAGGRVLDLAMGSGRNAVFLALAGYRVEGEDILPEAVEFARSLARRHQVAIEARVGDVTRADALPSSTYDGIMVFNFLDRSLLQAIAAALTPGGVLIYETFTTEQGRRVRRPRNPQWLLEPMELHDRMTEQGLEVLAYREGEAGPRRFVGSLVARRPA